MTITFDQARQVVDGTLAHGAAIGAAPLTVAVLDPGGHLVAFARQDGSGIARPQLATGKAWGALGLGVSSRQLAAMAQERPTFVSALVAASEGRVIPAPGGVLVSQDSGHGPVLVGAVGVSGDNSDVDEACAIAGAFAAGLIPDPATPVA